MIGIGETIPSPLYPQPLTLDALPLRPVVRRWAVATVRELSALLPRRPPGARRRLLAIFVDGLGARALASAVADGHMPFVARLRDGPLTSESRTFSGMPSTTTAFQAGLFYGLRHPDVPAFNWYDRRERRPLMMFKPAHAAQVEARIRRQVQGGLMEGGASYLSILRGGASDHLNTAGAAALLARQEWPGLDPARLDAQVLIHRQTAVAAAVRLARELGPFLWGMRRTIRETGTGRHEFNYLLHHLLVSTLVQEVAFGQAILDLVRGLPRVFINLHDFDEASHRRGPAWAAHTVLRGIDRAIEALYAIAAAVPDPVDVYVFSDHGQIEVEPFERRFGWTFADWVRGAGDGDVPPRLPEEVERAVGARAGRPGFEPDLQVIDCGNYGHVYFEREGPLDARAIVERHGRTLARILLCPGVGLAILRHGEGAIAFSQGRRIDPEDPSTVPAGASPAGVRAAMEDLAHSKEAGDVLVYGAWNHGGALSLSWEWSSHGGPSPQETETFLLHPRGLPFDPGRVGHASDLHHAFRSLYGGLGV